MKKLIFLFILVISVVLYAETDFRIMSYNSLRFPDASGEERKEYFKKIFAFVHPDILLMQEVASEAGADTLLAILNSNQNKYSKAEFIDDGTMNSILFYNNNFIQFVEVNQVYATPRNINEYVLNVLGKELRCYSCHLRASTGEDNEQERLQAVTNLRNHLTELPDSCEFVVVGDMNFYTSSEPGYQKFVEDEEDNSGKCLDLCPLVGDWHNNEDFALVHTQSPRANAFGGGIGGGLDDKFDFIFTSYNFNNDSNIEYIEDSFVTVGNDGNHFNESVNFGENTSVPQEIADALYYASDHLPVYADFSVDEDFVGLISPNGGENWHSGEMRTILWETSLQDFQLTIKLIKAEPYQETLLANNITNTNSWNWTIPDSLPMGTDYKIRIETGQYSDESNSYFNINYTQPEDVVFISEYVEGSSYNKALELFNPCDYPVDLSNFVLKKQTNGSGEFGSDFSVSAVLPSHQVIVIAHPSSCQEILDVADYTDSGVCNFNGNDAIGLFKNNVLVDLLGYIDSDEYWGRDETLVRRPYISVPSDTFNVYQWSQYPSDTFEFLGSHLYDPSFFQNNQIVIFPYIKLYPNPVFATSKSYITLKSDLFENNNKIKISIYNLKGERIYEKVSYPNSGNLNLNIDNLKNSGVYIYRVKSKNAIRSGKLTIIK